MKIIRGISRWNLKFNNPVVALGVFDGLHHGHRRLIFQMNQRVKAIGGTPLVVTFDPHPVKVLHPEKHLSLISSLEYRLMLLKEQGVKACLVVPFTKRFSRMSPERFVGYYLVKKLGAVEVIVGDDFHFGKGRRGDVELLQKIGSEKGFRVHKIIVRKSHGKKQVSSTRIRQFLAKADINNAKKLLDRPVAIMGRVIKGDGRGRRLGFPTANLDANLTGFAPRGVFCVYVHVGKNIFFGVANIGSRPSFKQNAAPNIEVHIFDFDRNIYGRKILVEFVKKVRDEKLFPSQQGLVDQLYHDKDFARKWFAQYGEL